MKPPSVVASPSGNVRSPNPTPHKHPRSLHGLLVAAVSLGLLLDFSTAQAQPPSWPALEFTPVVSGLGQPVHVTHAGDGSGRLFIVEKAGRIRILHGGALLPTPFLDISSITRSTGFEEGLLSVAFPPGLRRHRSLLCLFHR